jgi:hypothetical protein
VVVKVSKQHTMVATMPTYACSKDSSNRSSRR